MYRHILAMILGVTGASALPAHAFDNTLGQLPGVQVHAVIARDSDSAAATAERFPNRPRRQVSAHQSNVRVNNVVLVPRVAQLAAQALVGSPVSSAQVASVPTASAPSASTPLKQSAEQSNVFAAYQPTVAKARTCSRDAADCTRAPEPQTPTSSSPGQRPTSLLDSLPVAAARESDSRSAPGDGGEPGLPLERSQGEGP